MRLVFMGTPDFAVPSLERLEQGPHDLAGVVSRPDRPAGRGRKMASPPVKAAARRMGLPVAQPESLADPTFLATLRAFNADLFVVVAFAILPKPVLDMPRLGSVNLHPSLLPAYRGAAPMQWAIIRGERETGVTTFLLQSKVDAGDILMQRRVRIGPDETCGELHERLKVLGAEVVLETVDALASGRATPRPQRASRVSRAPKLRREDARIDWDRGATSIRNLIRGTNPVPGAFTDWRGRVLKLYRATACPGEGAPGEVLAADAKTGFVVATGNGSLRLEEVQPSGKRRMSGAAFVRGGQISPGEWMGTASGRHGAMSSRNA